MSHRDPPRGLTPREFFDLALPGCSMSDAHVSTRIAYSTVHAIAKGARVPQAGTAKRLEEWSREAGAEHGAYISAALALGVGEGTPDAGEAA